jgi:O-antigen ligase
MAFALLILVNAVLIIRPTELVPGWEEYQIYNAVILAALVASAQGLLRETQRILDGRSPAGACVFGLLVAVFLSHASRGAVAEAITGAVMFLKIVLYYLLVVANVRTAARLRAFIAWVCALMSVQAGLAVLQYMEYIDFEALRPFEQNIWDYSTGELIGRTPRLCGAGIFNDPNDLCVLLVIGALLALCLLTRPGAGPGRFLWAAPLAVFAWGVPFTQSRGGLLALVAGLGALLVVRIGARRGLLLTALALPVLAVGLGGRMTNIAVDDKNDTSNARMQHWSDGLLAVRRSPVFGLGQGTYESFAGHVAHNSYVEGYVELGLFGGTLFTGAFAYAAWALVRVGPRLNGPKAREFRHLRCYLLAILAALLMGLVSLSRNYSLPTYLFLGLVTAYLHLVEPHAPRAVPPLTQKLAVRAGALSVAFFLAMNVGTALLVQW